MRAVGRERGTIGREAATLLAALAGLSALRLAASAYGVAPLHFDEAQYWAYGEDLAWGYYSKPPMVAWVIRAATELLGDTEFGVRAASPLIHAWIAWLVFATARRLYDARTALYAGLCYATLPGVAAGAQLMTTDTPMMAAWALGLYAYVRAREADALGWWLLLGAAIGLGFLGKYTIVALPLGLLGHALTRRRDDAAAVSAGLGPWLAAAAALLVAAPNLAWNAANGFAAFRHVGDNTKLGGGAAFSPEKAAEFVAAQAAVFGPLLFVGLIWLALARRWRGDARMALLLWLAAPLLLAMSLQAFLTRAHPNWAAPAYISASIAVAAFLLERGRSWILKGSVAIGFAATLAFVGAGVALRDRHSALPRAVDPFKKMRPYGPICARGLALRAGDEPLFGVDRRLLSDCLFAGKLGIGAVRAWAPGEPGNHLAMVAPLEAGEPASMIAVLEGERAGLGFALDRFERVELLEEGRIRTHADREAAYVIARVSGFRGY